MLCNSWEHFRHAAPTSSPQYVPIVTVVKAINMQQHVDPVCASAEVSRHVGRYPPFLKVDKRYTLPSK